MEKEGKLIPNFKEYNSKLTVYEPLFLKNSKTSKKIFWSLCDDMYNAGILKEMYIKTIGLCSNALTDYMSYSEKIRREGTLNAEGNISPYVNLRNGAEARYVRYIDKLGLSPKSTLSLKLNMSDEEEDVDDF